MRGECDRFQTLLVDCLLRYHMNAHDAAHNIRIVLS